MQVCAAAARWYSATTCTARALCSNSLTAKLYMCICEAGVQAFAHAHLFIAYMFTSHTLMQVFVVAGATLYLLYRLLARWFKGKKVGEPATVYTLAVVQPLSRPLAEPLNYNSNTFAGGLIYFAGADRNASHACYCTVGAAVHAVYLAQLVVAFKLIICCYCHTLC
jgi:hypothetical protein